MASKQDTFSKLFSGMTSDAPKISTLGDEGLTIGKIKKEKKDPFDFPFDDFSLEVKKDEEEIKEPIEEDIVITGKVPDLLKERKKRLKAEKEQRKKEKREQKRGIKAFTKKAKKLEKEKRIKWSTSKKNQIREYYREHRAQSKKDTGAYPKAIDPLDDLTKLAFQKGEHKWLLYAGVLANPFINPTGLPGVAAYKLLERKTVGKERRAFVDFVNEKEKERITALSYNEAVAENRLGGFRAAYGTLLPTPVNNQFRTLHRNIVKSYTLSLLDPGKYDVYADINDNENRAATLGGNAMGNILSFMTLQGVAQSTGIASKLLKLSLKGKVAKATLGRFLYRIGTVKKWLDLKTPLFTVVPWKVAPTFVGQSALKVGASATSTAIVRSFMNTVRNGAELYRKKDQLTKEEWNRHLKVDAVDGFIGGMLRGYGIGFINDPRSWGLRFLGDALYSLSEQGVQALEAKAKGIDYKWDTAAFFTDAVVGHVMGEVTDWTQNRNGRNFKIALQNNTFKKAYNEARSFGLPKDVAFMSAETVRYSVQKYVQKHKLFPSSEAIRQFIIETPIQFNGTKVAVQFTKTPNGDLIMNKDFTKVINQNIDNAYNNLALKHNIDPDDVAQLKRFKVIENGLTDEYIEFLKSKGKIGIEQLDLDAPLPERFNAIEKMSRDEFFTKFHNIAKEQFPAAYKGLDEAEAMSKTDTLISIKNYNDVNKTAINKPQPEDQNIMAAYRDPLPEDIIKLDKVGNFIVEKNDTLIRQLRTDKAPQTKSFRYDDALDEVYIRLRRNPDTIKDISTDAKLKKTIIDVAKKALIDRVRGDSVSSGIDVDTGKTQRNRRYVSLFDVDANGNERINSIASKQVGAEQQDQKDTSSFYRMYTEYMKDKSSIKDVVAHLLRNDPSITMPKKDIVTRMNALGFETTLNQVKHSLNKMKNNLSDLANNALKSQFSKDTFSEADAKKDFQNAQTDVDVYNRTTGLIKNVSPQTAKHINENGALVLDISRDYINMRDKFNKNVGERLTNKVGKEIENMINEANTEGYGDRNGSFIDVVNPEADDSTRFIFYSKGLSTEEFFREFDLIANTLKNNYSDKEHMRKFSLIVKTLDNKYDIVSTFKNISTGEIRKGDFDINMSKEDIAPFDVKDLLPAWKEAKLNAMQRELLVQGDDIVQGNEKNILENNRSDKFPDITSDYTRSAVTADEMARGGIESEVEGGKERRMEILSDTKNQDVNTQQQLNFWQRRVKGAKDYFNKTFNAASGLERQEGSKKITQAVRGAPGALVQNSKGVTQDLIRDYSGITDENFNESYRRIGLMLDVGVEMEALKIFNPKNNFEQEVTRSVLSKKLDYTKGSEDIRNIDTDYKGKTATGNELLKLWYASGKDPYFATKFLQENYDIKLDTILSVFKTYLTKTLPKQQALMSKFKSISMADAGYATAINKIRGNIKSEIIDTINKDTKLTIKNNANFEDKKMRGNLLKVADTIDNIELRELTKRRIKSYYDNDPETLAYVHRITMKNGENLNVFATNIEKQILGKAQKGKHAFNTDAKDITGRKFLTTFDAIEAGYTVADHGFFEKIQGTTTYLANKLYTKTTYRNMGVMYTDKMLSAINTFTEGRDPFIYDKNKIVGLSAAARQGLDEFMKDHNSSFAFIPTKDIIDGYEKSLNNIRRQIVSLEKTARSTEDINNLIELKSMESSLEAAHRKTQMLFDIYATPKGQEAMDHILKFGINRPLWQNSFNEAKYSEPQYAKFLKSITKVFTDNKFTKYNVEGSQGLIFHKDVQRLMGEYIFGDSYIDGGAPERSWYGRAYDKVNLVGKVLNLVKPQIMFINGLQQGQMADPRFTAHYLNAGKAWDTRSLTKDDLLALRGKVQKATGVLVDENTNLTKTQINDLRIQGRTDVNAKDALVAYETIKNRELWDMAEKYSDIFNSTMDTADVYTDAHAAAMDIIGDNKFLGKLVSDVMGEKNAFKKFFKSGWFLLRNGHRNIQKFTWEADKINRLALFDIYYNRVFNQAHAVDPGNMTFEEKKKVAYEAGEYVNLKMVHYARIPRKTRQMMNRFIAFPTFRVGTWRMYKNMVKDAAKGMGRLLGTDAGDGKYKLFGKEFEAKYKFSNESTKQAFYEIMPFVNTIAMKVATKALFLGVFNYGFDSLLDAISGYRAKKRTGINVFDRSTQFFSFAGPLWEIEKMFTRLKPIAGGRAPKQLLRFNIARFPLLVWDLMANRDIIGRQIRDRNSSPINQLRQTGFYLMSQYFPFGGDVRTWKQEDINLFSKIINTFNVGYMYNTKSPNELVEVFNKAAGNARTIGDVEKAQRELNRGFLRIQRQLFKEDEVFKNYFEMIERAKKDMRNTPIN